MGNPSSKIGWEGALWGDEVKSKEIITNAASYYKFQLKYMYSTDV